MIKKDQRNQRRAGFYWIKGKPYVSVTNVLKILDKPGLRWWFGQQVYLAMANDPSLSQREALASPYKTSGKARDRGSAVHHIIENYDPSGKKKTLIPSNLKGYVDAFSQWMKDNNVLILAAEETVVSEEHQFAGTLDLLVKLGNSREHLIIDIKTGKNIYPESFLQLSAYKHALLEKSDKWKVDAMGVLLLRESGNYVFERGEDSFEVFLAAKKLFEWKNRELLEKIRND